MIRTLLAIELGIVLAAVLIVGSSRAGDALRLRPVSPADGRPAVINFSARDVVAPLVIASPDGHTELFRWTFAGRCVCAMRTEVNCSDVDRIGWAAACASGHAQTETRAKSDIVGRNVDGARP